MRNRWRIFRSDESGGVMVAGALGLLALLAVSAVVVDLSHSYVVRSEIRKAAEAGAFAGARALTLGAVGSPRPNWDNAKNTATLTVQKNFADTVKLTDFNVDGSLEKVQVGYWDLNWTKDTAPANLNGYLNPSAYTPSATEVSAVKVNIAKTAGGTGSSAPMTTYFASVMGINNLEVRTSVVATTFPPSSAGEGSTLPLVFPKAFVKNYWENEKTFRLYSDYHIEVQVDGTNIEEGGQWTSFKTADNSASYAKYLVTNGNPEPLKVGDNIYIQTGTEASVYKELDCRVGQTMLVTVVDNDFATKSYTPVKALLGFEVTGYSQGQKYVEGHFVKDFVSTSGGTGGTFDPDYKDYTPTYVQPRLLY